MSSLRVMGVLNFEGKGAGSGLFENLIKLYSKQGRINIF